MKQNHTRKIGTALGLAALLILEPRASAEETAAAPKSGFMKFMEQDYLFGDWGGLRTKLKEKGVDFEFVYFGAVPSNVGGGLKEGSVYQGGLMMLLDLYSDRLAGYEGGQFHVGGLSIHNGREFSRNFIGDLNKVSMLDFPDTLHLWELWYEQKFWDNKVAIKFGQLVIDRDFILPEYYNSLAGITFLNQTFFYPTMAFNVWDQPFFPVGDHALASTPYGTPGVRLRVDPCDYAYFQVGAYDGNPDRTRGGVRVKLSNEEGALIYGELTLKINQSKEASGPPGNLKIGAYYHTDDFVDMFDGSHVAFDNASVAMGGGALGLVTNPRFHSGNYGIYFLADQTLWRESGKDDPARQGLVGFFRAAYAPPDRNLAWLGVDGGLVYKGLIPGRDWDTLALGGSYLEISRDLRRAQDNIRTTLDTFFPGAGLGDTIPHADYEAVIELSYKAQITAWWTVQPSIQRVFHPGGRVQGNIPDAWAVLIQTTLRF